MTGGEGRPQRADARRNQERILDAAIDRLGQDPQASMADIAAGAGVGRVTLYGHFPSRHELIEAALVRVLDRGDDVLETVDLTGDAPEALGRLIEASWLLTAQAGGLLEAARDVLSSRRVRELHDKPAARVIGLIERGQRAGELRADLSAEWMASALHHLMKGAADEAARGVLEPSDVPRLISALALRAFAPHGGLGDGARR